MKPPRSVSKPTGPKTVAVRQPRRPRRVSAEASAPDAPVDCGDPEAEAAPEPVAETGRVFLNQALLSLGVPLEGRVLVLGTPKAAARIWGGETPTDVALTLSSDFGVRGKGDFDRVILLGGASYDGLGPIHDRLEWAASHVSARGRVILSVGALAAPLESQGKEGPVGPYDGLLFPEAIAAGDAGARRARVTPLAASTWLLLARSVGLACVDQSGIGNSPLPEPVRVVHEQRLVVFDHDELRTGRMILILARNGTV